MLARTLWGALCLHITSGTTLLTTKLDIFPRSLTIYNTFRWSVGLIYVSWWDIAARWVLKGNCLTITCFQIARIRLLRSMHIRVIIWVASVPCLFTEWGSCYVHHHRWGLSVTGSLSCSSNTVACERIISYVPQNKRAVFGNVLFVVVRVLYLMRLKQLKKLYVI